MFGCVCAVVTIDCVEVVAPAMKSTVHFFFQNEFYYLYFSPDCDVLAVAFNCAVKLESDEAGPTLIEMTDLYLLSIYSILITYLIVMEQL